MVGKAGTEEKKKKEDGMDMVMKRKHKLMEVLHQIARGVTTQQDLRVVHSQGGIWTDGMVSATKLYLISIHVACTHHWQ